MSFPKLGMLLKWYSTADAVNECLEIRVPSGMDRTEVAKELTATGIPYREAPGVFVLEYTNAIDVLSVCGGHVDALVDLLKPKMSSIPTLNVVRTHPDAVMPFKTRMSDVGYDLTLIRLHKRISDVVFLYDTGIRVRVSDGFYCEIIPRSSIIKSGYMLANNTGVIDRSYDGNLYVAVVKVDACAKDLELPYRGFQLVLRPQIYADVREVESSDVASTSRGAGGFGSTGK